MDNDFREWYEQAALPRIHAELIDLESAEALEAIEQGFVAQPDHIYLYSDEWEDRRWACEAFLRAQAGRFEREVDARACTAREVPRGAATAFLEQYHIQGMNPLALACFGLYAGEDLVGVLSLGPHRWKGTLSAVVDRLCFRAEVQVVGGAEELLTQAQTWARSQGYEEILWNAEHRFSLDAECKRLGFVLGRMYGPSHFYVRAGRRVARQDLWMCNNRRPAGTPVLEWAHTQGFIRVRDAGRTCWVINLRPGDRSTWSERNSERVAKLHAQGVFKNAHMRGYFRSAKNAGEVYYGSSYELRCMFELEQDARVRAFRRCEAFQAADGHWRNPDLWVEFVDGHAEIWEVKPAVLVGTSAVRAQLDDTTAHASKLGVAMRVWTEQHSDLGSDAKIISWAHTYLADRGDTAWADRRKSQRKAIGARHYKKEQAASVVVACAYCGCDHTVLPRTYARNVARHDGTYVCEAMAGHIGGSKPKLALRKENPHAAEGKKECCRCHAILPIDAFEHRQKSRDGLSSACKPCISIANAARYQARKAHTSSC